MDILSDALNIIRVHKNAGKSECRVNSNKITGEVLKIMQREGYIGEFEQVTEGPSSYFVVKGIGPINNCGTIKPRIPIKAVDVSKAEDQYLPSKDFGVLIITTPKGIVTNKEIKDLKSGGRLVAFIY